MSLDLELVEDGHRVVFETNITHNLTKMADEVGLYKPLWRPEEVSIDTAEQLISPLKTGLVKLVLEPRKYKEFDAPNNWGTLEQFIPWLVELLVACEEHPEARIEVFV